MQNLIQLLLELQCAHIFQNKPCLLLTGLLILHVSPPNIAAPSDAKDAFVWPLPVTLTSAVICACGIFSPQFVPDLELAERQQENIELLPDSVVLDNQK